MVLSPAETDAIRETLAAVENPLEAARHAGLRYISDETPGYSRRKRGRGFSYYAPDGSLVTDKKTRARLDTLAIPPAWTDVWISPARNGHIQATGRDERGRKQYIYHPSWDEIRNQRKYDKMLLFGEALPLIRERTAQDLRRHGLGREKVIALIVRLLEATLIRVGNEEYTRANESFGLTTLRDRHVTIEGASVEFTFTGKTSKKQVVRLRDRRLARLVERCKEIPGYELFQYLDDDGQRQRVDSGDVNDYLREITGENFTAKDFRTWGGTVRAVRALLALGPADDEKQAQRNVTAAVKRVAAELGNTPTVCRAYYIHPAVLSCYVDGSLYEHLPEVQDAEPETPYALTPEEEAVMAFLRWRTLGA